MTPASCSGSHETANRSYGIQLGGNSSADQLLASPDSDSCIAMSSQGAVLSLANDGVIDSFPAEQVEAEPTYRLYKRRWVGVIAIVCQCIPAVVVACVDVTATAGLLEFGVGNVAGMVRSYSKRQYARLFPSAHMMSSEPIAF